MSATTQSSVPRSPRQVPPQRPRPGAAAPARPLAPPDEPEAASTDGRSTRWDDHRAARRTSLVNAARKAVHRNGPDVSMEEIAAFAGTSKSIIYRYFEDKNGLQIAVGEAVVSEIRDALTRALDASDTLRSGLEAMIGTYLEMIEHSPNVYYFVTRTGSIIGTDAGPRVTGDGRPPLTTFIDTINALMAGRFVAALDLDAHVADVWASGSMAFVRGAGERWLAHRADSGATDRETLAAQVATWLWDGLAAASPATAPRSA